MNRHDLNIQSAIKNIIRSLITYSWIYIMVHVTKASVYWFTNKANLWEITILFWSTLMVWETWAIIHILLHTDDSCDKRRIFPITSNFFFCHNSIQYSNWTIIHRCFPYSCLCVFKVVCCRFFVCGKGFRCYFNHGLSHVYDYQHVTQHYGF